jgi:glycosyltransferase involved in cell wall biosynthesis
MRNLSLKLLFIGTLPPPNHGQAIAFQAALESIKEDNSFKVIETTFRAESLLSSLFKILDYLFKVPFNLFFYRPDKIYFLCSRSLIGGMRDVYLLFFCLFSKAEVLNHLHGSDFEEYIQSLNPLYRKLVIALYRRVDKHAVLIEGMHEQFQSVASLESCCIINNFYQEPSDVSHKMEMRKASDRLNICYISSILPSKGVFELIEAVKKLHVNNVHLSLTIAGGFLGDSFLNSEKTKEKFFSLIKDCSFIHYAGVVDIDEKYELLASNHILALPSYYQSEAVPLCIIEAMRMGCCILTTHYKYLPKLVKNNVNGFLVEPKSIDDIVTRVTEVAHNQELLQVISKNNSDMALTLYSEEKYKKNIRKFLGVDK